MFPGAAKGNKNTENQSDVSMSQSTGLRHSVGTSDLRTETRDLMSEIDDYIESINENFAAYSRESINTPKRTLAVAGETPKSALKVTNKSFTDDGVVPSSEDAELLFGNNTYSEGDFNDPYMTEKSLKDIGFSYNHNKYLSKSRNFVNHRKALTHVSPVCVQLADSASMADNAESGERESKTSAILDSTLVGSPLSSPYNSDSSLEKETLGMKTPRSKVISRTRHTFLHSPTTTDSTDSLSTVDTDSQMLHHTTPITVRYSNNSCVPVKNATDNSVYLNSGDEVTFV